MYIQILINVFQIHVFYYEHVSARKFTLTLQIRQGSYWLPNVPLFRSLSCPIYHMRNHEKHILGEEAKGIGTHFATCWTNWVNFSHSRVLLYENFSFLPRWTIRMLLDQSVAQIGGQFKPKIWVPGSWLSWNFLSF